MRKKVDFVDALVALAPGALDGIQAPCTIAAWVYVGARGDSVGACSLIVRTKP